MILLSTEIVQQNLKPVEPEILLNGAFKTNERQNVFDVWLKWQSFQKTFCFSSVCSVSSIPLGYHRPAYHFKMLLLIILPILLFYVWFLSLSLINKGLDICGALIRECLFGGQAEGRKTASIVLMRASKGKYADDNVWGASFQIEIVHITRKAPGRLLWGVGDHKYKFSSCLTPSAQGFLLSKKPGHRCSLTGWRSAHLPHWASRATQTHTHTHIILASCTSWYCCELGEAVQ